MSLIGLFLCLMWRLMAIVCPATATAVLLFGLSDEIVVRYPDHVTGACLYDKTCGPLVHIVGSSIEAWISVWGAFLILSIWVSRRRRREPVAPWLFSIIPSGCWFAMRIARFATARLLWSDHMDRMQRLATAPCAASGVPSLSCWHLIEETEFLIPHDAAGIQEHNLRTINVVAAAGSLCILAMFYFLSAIPGDYNDHADFCIAGCYVSARRRRATIATIAAFAIIPAACTTAHLVTADSLDHAHFSVDISFIVALVFGVFVPTICAHWEHAAFNIISSLHVLGLFHLVFLRVILAVAPTEGRGRLFAIASLTCDALRLQMCGAMLAFKLPIANYVPPDKGVLLDAEVESIRNHQCRCGAETETVVLLPCGDIFGCLDCYGRESAHKCPRCHNSILGFSMID